MHWGPRTSPSVCQESCGRGIAYPSISSERALAAPDMINDGFRIGAAEFYVSALQLDWSGAPWLMDQLRVESRKLRHPAPHIGAVGIELLALQHRIEHPEIGRSIGAAARDPLPVGGIAGGIGVDERVPEPLLAFAPVDQEMLDREGGDH